MIINPQIWARRDRKANMAGVGFHSPGQILKWTDAEREGDTGALLKRPGIAIQGPKSLVNPER